MPSFPKTTIGHLEVPRLIIGTNWFLGYSHTTRAKDHYIGEHVRNPKAIADILEVFFRNGVNAVLGLVDIAALSDAMKMAEDRTGIPAIRISTPFLPFGPETPAMGFDLDEVARILDTQKSLGADVCLPHQSVTDSMVDRCSHEIRHMATVCRMIREREMIPGLSTHMPESILYADERGLDVETYVSIYNSAGFLMQLEVDWTARIIQAARKPVLTIKPMAAGQLRPFQGLTFVWNTIREQDMVAIGTMSPQEAEEVLDISLSILEQQQPQFELQETRSKKSLVG